MLVVVASCFCSVMWVREGCRAGRVEGEGMSCSKMWVRDGCLGGLR